MHCTHRVHVEDFRKSLASIRVCWIRKLFIVRSLFLSLTRKSSQLCIQLLNITAYRHYSPKTHTTWRYPVRAYCPPALLDALVFLWSETRMWPKTCVQLFWKRRRLSISKLIRYSMTQESDVSAVKWIWPGVTQSLDLYLSLNQKPSHSLYHVHLSCLPIGIPKGYTSKMQNSLCSFSRLGRWTHTI